ARCRRANHPGGEGRCSLTAAPTACRPAARASRGLRTGRSKSSRPTAAGSGASTPPNFCGGAPLAQYFDMIAGTSTGGIIALGLGLGIPTAEIKGFYHDDGRKIFPPLPGGWIGRVRRFLRSLNGPKLVHEELEEALKRRFTDHLLGDSMTRLVIPAFMMPKTEIAVFKTDHHRDFRNDHATPMWKVARATSAAPTYLKGLEHEESGRIFIDGGVWANNPIMVALVDAITAYAIGFDQVAICSIAT